MKTEKLTTIMFNCVILSFILLILPACQGLNQADSISDQSIHKPAGAQQIAEKKEGLITVQKTGSKISYMENDDGDIRAGLEWPAPRFTDNENGTVTDHLAGLMWTQNANQAGGKADWEAAVAGAAGCRDGGYSDWRLPNRFEMESLLDLGNYGPALPKNNHFNGVKSDYYWTSTTMANNGEDQAWVVHLYVGFVSNDDNGGDHYVWYVRNNHTN